MPETIKAVIFDIDNTLFDYDRADRQALEALQAYASDRFGWNAEDFPRRYEEVRREILRELGYSGSCRNRMLRIQRMLEKAGLSLYPHAVAMYQLYWDTFLRDIVPYEGVSHTLLTLKQNGIRIGTGTDMTAYMQLRKLEKLDLLRYMDFMVSSEEAGEEKPSESVFSLCARKAGVEPSACLFVGDHPEKDCRGALLAGMHALWYNDKGRSCSTDMDQITCMEQVLLRVL